MPTRTPTAVVAPATKTPSAGVAPSPDPSVEQPNRVTPTRIPTAVILPATEIPGAGIAPSPKPPTERPDGSTWILESIGGQPVIKGTFATLMVDGPQIGGVDGCNFFGGRHESGEPVFEPDGEISLPTIAVTQMLCADPPGIIDQADSFMSAMMRERAKVRVVDDRLHMLDPSGEVLLVFVRQAPLPGQPRDLVGTGWRLVDDDATYGAPAATVLFLDSRTAIGTTACRDYAVSYTASAGRIRMPYKGMHGPTEACSRNAIEREHTFIGDFGWANEYSFYQTGGFQRLVMRTSKGETLTFEPLPQPPAAIFNAQWSLTRFLQVRSGGSGMKMPEDTDVVPGTDITTVFNEDLIEGSLGCHSYAYRATNGDGAKLIGADGTISIGGATLSTENSCDGQARISPQQRQYLDFLARAERYHVFDDRLALLSSDGDTLVFQRE